MKIIYILFFVSFLFACNKNHNKQDIYLVKEDSLIYTIVDSMLMSDTVWRNDLLVPYPIFIDDDYESRLKKLRERDSLKLIWDTAHLYQAFSDTLMLFSKTSHAKSIKNIEKYFKNNIYNVDTSFYPLFYRLLTDSVIGERRFYVNQLKTRHNYKIIPDDSVEIIFNRGFRVVEIHFISRIVFNKTFDKACFYEASLCGGECGGGLIFFLEKRGNSWRILERKLLWVS
jgi:hypothetical protein